MKKLDLRLSSCPADNRCLVYCRSQADLLLGCDDATLYRVVTKRNRTHYVWGDEGYPLTGAACRAFQEDEIMLDDDIFDVKFMHKVIPEESIFCFGGYVYYLQSRIYGNTVIKRINAYSEQKIIESIMHDYFREYDLESVYLANFYVLEGNTRKYVMTCWGVVCRENLVYFPVFDKDRHFIHERDLDEYVKEEIPAGTIFTAHGKYYRTAKAQDGRLFIEYSDIPFVCGKEDTAVLPGRQATIIQMPLANGGQS